MPITPNTLAANPNHVNSGVRVEMVCKRLGCGETFEVVLSQSRRRLYCSKRCSGLVNGKPPRTDPEIQAQRMRERYAADPASNPFFGRTPVNYRGFGCGGFDEILGFSVRSSWERDYLRGLQVAG